MDDAEKPAEKAPQKRKGTFQPGNTAARKPRAKGVSAAARKFGKKAVKLLQEMALSSRDERVRLQAVQELLRRGYGQIAPAPVAERAAVEGVEPVRDARGVVILPARDLAPPNYDAMRAELAEKLKRIADAGEEERRQELRELEDLRAEVARLRALVPDAQTAAADPNAQPEASQTHSSARGEARPAGPVKLVSVPKDAPSDLPTEEEARQYRHRRMLAAPNETDVHAAAVEDQSWMSPAQWGVIWGRYLK